MRPRVKRLEVYGAIRQGERQKAMLLMKEAEANLTKEKRESQRAIKAREYAKKHIYDGVDWRYRLELGIDPKEIPKDAGGLGTMESNEDKPYANRMKKRGMSWTIKGAQRMGKVIQLTANRELGRWCSRSKPSLTSSSHEGKMNWDIFDDGKRQYVRGGIPVFSGPHASRPWVQGIRNLVYSSYRLN